jgi:predicted nucleic acid-binding protein
MPTGKDHIVYWDTCVFLAWMNNEQRGPGEMEGLGKIASLVERAEVILITSTITRAEILYSRTSAEAMKQYDTLLRRSNVVPQNVDLPIAKLTSELMDFYIKTDFELLTPDAIHLATAIHYNAAEFHTFDGVDPNQKPRNSKRYGRSGLLKLDGSVAGRALKVTRPSAVQLELGLSIPGDGESDFQLTSDAILPMPNVVAIDQKAIDAPREETEPLPSSNPPKKV